LEKHLLYELNDYNYHLPSTLIAQKPNPRRDHSRLLVLDKKNGDIHHGRFNDLTGWLNPGDVLVANDTAVIPAKMFGHKETGGKVEVLLLDYPGERSASSKATIFRCLIKASKRPSLGSRLFFEDNVTAYVTGFKDGIYKAEFILTDSIDKVLEKIGNVPLPPYIERRGSIENTDDVVAYQTVYAKTKGAVAAPTAGLHFTKALLKNLKGIGVSVVYITLHVGYGTFSPVRAEDIRDHQIHTEAFHIPEKTVRTVNAAKRQGKQVVAVGTTSCRTLEYAGSGTGQLTSGSGLCDLFIYPGYRFRIVDGLITNFHLPQSTLLMLVSALAGRERILSTYREAIEKGYRFYSYGDAMMIR
jgi:S-adenosylmethionine:tRNA ribosyltransferase-isomerase